MDAKILGLMIPILGIVLGIGMIITVVWLLVSFGHRREQLVYDTAVKLAEKGQPIPTALFANVNQRVSDLRRGLILLLVGAALCISLYEVGAPWTFGLLPAFAGLGYLIVWFVERRKDQSTSEPAA
jgi:hypothetical protein